MSDEISIRLQKVRRIYGLSQRALAKRAGVTNSSISMIEQGKVSPSLNSLERLLRGIPMDLKNFFTIDFDDKSTCFFRSYQMFLSTREHVDSFRLADNEDDKRSQLSYEVYAPNSDTGETMLVNQSRSSGFIVRGTLDVAINTRFKKLEVGDGFIVEAGHPYRFRNISNMESILVINRL